VDRTSCCWGWNFDSTLVYQVLPGQPAFLMHHASPPTADDLVAASDAPASPQLFPLNRACGTLGYTISPLDAGRLLAFCTPLRPMRLYEQEAAATWTSRGIDLMMSVFYPRLRAYVSVPPLGLRPIARPIRRPGRWSPRGLPSGSLGFRWWS
jgi:hypothetical protein